MSKKNVNTDQTGRCECGKRIAHKNSNICDDCLRLEMERLEGVEAFDC